MLKTPHIQVNAKLFWQFLTYILLTLRHIKIDYSRVCHQQFACVFHATKLFSCTNLFITSIWMTSLNYVLILSIFNWFVESGPWLIAEMPLSFRTRTCKQIDPLTFVAMKHWHNVPMNIEIFHLWHLYLHVLLHNFMVILFIIFNLTVTFGPHFRNIDHNFLRM